MSKPIGHESSKVNFSVSCGLPVMRCQCEAAICITKGGGWRYGMYWLLFCSCGLPVMSCLETICTIKGEGYR